MHKEVMMAGAEPPFGRSFLGLLFSDGRMESEQVYGRQPQWNGLPGKRKACEVRSYLKLTKIRLMIAMQDG